MVVRFHVPNHAGVFGPDESEQAVSKKTDRKNALTLFSLLSKRETPDREDERLGRSLASKDGFPNSWEIQSAGMPGLSSRLSLGCQ
jgi:hypothetical protein